MPKKKRSHKLKQKNYAQAVYLSNRPYDILVEPAGYNSLGEFGYLATNPELKGLLAEGDTPFEAVAHLNDARVTWIWACLDDKQVVPEPTNAYLKD